MCSLTGPMLFFKFELLQFVLLVASDSIRLFSTDSTIHCCTACADDVQCIGVTYEDTECTLLDQLMTPMWTIAREAGGVYRFTQTPGLEVGAVGDSCSGTCGDPNAICKDGSCVCKTAYKNTAGTCVVDPSVNVALFYDSVEQSSTKLEYHASLAVDGNKDPVMSHMSCSHTVMGEKYPWFRLTLNDTYNVGRIVITNRQDAVWDRLRDFTVHLDGALCYNYTGEAPPSDVEIQCDGGPVFARILEITKKSVVLTICELEIYGDGDG